MLILYTAAILLSAALLFMVQPMAARLVLPRLGGSPAVWNTCMVFFQGVLLLGYGYAHLLTRWKSLPGQIALHALVLLAGLAMLPIAVRAGWTAPAEGRSASLWVLGLLGVSVGAPFFVLSTTGPLLQRWFAHTDHKDAHDPYFLYSASNIGSLASLLAYPVLLEPWLRLTTPGASVLPPRLLPISQSTLWTIGYAVFTVLAVAAGVIALKRRTIIASPASTIAAPMDVPAPSAEAAAISTGKPAPRAAAPAVAPARAATPTLKIRLAWVAMAFVPSSLMLGVTQYLSTDIASIPLLWIVPLTLYLLTFIIAFSRRGAALVKPMRMLLGVLAITIAATFRLTDKPALWMLLILHPAVLFAAGVAWHGRLAQTRPAAIWLTEYYFWIALGGVLGGALEALAAPALFIRVYEYPIMLALACLMALWPLAGSPWFRQTGRLALALDIAVPVLLAAAMIIADPYLIHHYGPKSDVRFTGQVLSPAAVALTCLFRPLRAALAVGIIFVVAFLSPGTTEPLLHASRTFFGVYRVVERPATPAVVADASGSRTVEIAPRRVFYHGTTTHGTQFVDPSRASIPTSYYQRSGPIGQVFQAYQGSPKLNQVAVIGLGAGSLAVYSQPPQTMTFYEIDPEVIRIATTPELFSFISDSQHRGANIACVAGDGRLRIAQEPDGWFGLIVLDAFSSDAIPVHLITQEAMEIYLKKLAPGGVIAAHISNYYMDLRPVLEAIGRKLNLAGLICDEQQLTSLQQVLEDKRVSTWVVLARDRADLGPLVGAANWSSLMTGDPSTLAPYLWTDDYSNFLRILRTN